MCVCMLYPVLLVIYIDVGTIDVALAIGIPYTQHNSGVVICRCVICVLRVCICCTILVWESLCMSVRGHNTYIFALPIVGSATLFVLYCVHM